MCKETFDNVKKLILDNPCESYWLKKAVKAIEKRDINDMLSDIRALNDIHKLYREKWNVSY